MSRFALFALGFTTLIACSDDAPANGGAQGSNDTSGSNSGDGTAAGSTGSNGSGTNPNPTPTSTSTTPTPTPTSTGTSQGPTPPPPGTPGPARTFKVYVAGESIEARNRFVSAPFGAAGALDNHGTDPNRTDEFGWMVPFADHLKYRDGGITISWVGSDRWKGVDDANYNGAYPSAVAPFTSALSGTSIPSWISYPGTDDLVQNKRFCYDVAIAARGGNDFSTSDATYKSQLKQVIRMLASGSTCRAQPLVMVTTHMPDDRQNGMSNSAFVAAQTQRYKQRVEDALAELKASDPNILTRELDVYSAFRNNWTTTAFPTGPGFWTGQNWDFTKMHRDGLHPRRLASIYAGEVAANAVDIPQLRALP